MNTEKSDSVVIAFDLFGTLVSTAGTAKEISKHVSGALDQAKRIATEWRRLSLEYTWRLTCMGLYEPFGVLLRRSLFNALDMESVSLPESSIDAIMSSYSRLNAFSDIVPGLSRIRTNRHIKAVIFSNGDSATLDQVVHQSADLSSMTDTFEQVISVEACRKFKPAKEVYYYLAKELGKNPDDPAQLKHIWLVSSNPFDVVGARAAGLNSVYIDRSAAGWSDGLLDGTDQGWPTVIVNDLQEAIEEVESRTGILTSASR